MKISSGTGLKFDRFQIQLLWSVAVTECVYFWYVEVSEFNACCALKAKCQNCSLSRWCRRITVVASCLLERKFSRLIQAPLASWLYHFVLWSIILDIMALGCMVQTGRIAQHVLFCFSSYLSPDSPKTVSTCTVCSSVHFADEKKSECTYIFFADAH